MARGGRQNESGSRKRRTFERYIAADKAVALADCSLATDNRFALAGCGPVAADNRFALAGYFPVAEDNLTTFARRGEPAVVAVERCSGFR